MDAKSAIGYVLYSPERDTFLGKLGEWYTDVRMAAVYAEPRAAKSAMNRCGVSFKVAVTPVTLNVRGIDMDTATAEAVIPPPPPVRVTVPKSKGGNASQPGKPGPKAA